MSIQVPLDGYATEIDSLDLGPAAAALLRCD
jgi:hypothetical protein